MPLKYTTTEKIARRLRGRLNIEDSPAVSTVIGSRLGYGDAIGGQLVDPQLLEQMGEQKEAYIDLILNQIYEVPLSLSHPITQNIMSEITECLVVSAVMKVHFQGSLNMTTGGDVQGLGIDLDRQAYMLLGTLTVGHNIYLPVSMPPLPQTYPGTMPPQPLVLPGENLRTIDQPDTVHRVYTFITHRKLDVLNEVDWTWYGDRQGRALGSEPLNY